MATNLAIHPKKLIDYISLSRLTYRSHFACLYVLLKLCLAFLVEAVCLLQSLNVCRMQRVASQL